MRVAGQEAKTTIEIPKGRCCCCGKPAFGKILDSELCKWHYALILKDINTSIDYFKNANEFRVADNLKDESTDEHHQ